MRRALSGILLVALSASACYASTSTVVLHPAREFAAVSGGWIVSQGTHTDGLLRLTLGVKAGSNGKKKMLDAATRISSPDSADFRKHLSFEEANALTAPSAVCKAEINAWLASAQIATSAVEWLPSGDFVRVEASAADASRLLGGARFSVYERTVSAGKRESLVRTGDAIRVPQAVSDCLDFVAGANSFPQQPYRPLAFSGPASAPGGEPGLPITPAVLKQRYNVTMSASTSSKAQQAVAEFQGQFYSPSDLKGFFQKYDPSGNSTMDRVIGYNGPDNPGVESMLDTEYIMSMANVKTWYWSTPAMDFCSDLINWITSVSSTPDAPHVHSISYGSQAADFCQSIEDRLNQEFQKMGSRGLSIIFSSGDSGSGFNGQQCNSNFPGESPWVTSVGATRFQQMAVGPEAAVRFFKSGGGFSWVWKTPDYQAADVKGYLNSAQNLPQSNQFNAAGRGTPDVAALGINFQVLYRGQWMGVGGTSASAPTFSGMMTLLNDYLLSNGKQPMGFLNPWIYKHPEMFYDVTVGDNTIGGVGFQCQKGWDPVTGLGTLDFKTAKATLAAELGIQE